MEEHGLQRSGEPGPQALGIPPELGWEGVRDRPGSAGRRWVMVAATALALGAAAAVRFAPVSDSVDAEEARRRADALSAFGPIVLRGVPPADVDAAVGGMGLADADAAALVADVRQALCRLVWLELYDADAEDGDVVLIRTAGFDHRLLLSKRPVAVAVPLRPGAAIELTGLIDGGGGGVTVGVVTQSGPLALRPMGMGETIVLPVRVR